MNKRSSGSPRRPRDPVAKAVRTPRFKQQVVPDKRWKERLKDVEKPVMPEPEKPESERPDEASS